MCATGAALVLSAAIAFALYQLLAKGLIGTIGPRLFTCIAMSGAAVGGAAAVRADAAARQPRSSRRSMLFYGVLLAIGATVLPSFLLNAALQHISAQANATIGTLSPVVTILLAVLMLGEPLRLDRRGGDGAGARRRRLVHARGSEALRSPSRRCACHSRWKAT